MCLLEISALAKFHPIWLRFARTKRETVSVKIMRRYSHGQQKKTCQGTDPALPKAEVLFGWEGGGAVLPQKWPLLRGSLA